MNNMIKHRLVQLNRGEIPEGYKKTDFGAFPCDWGSKQLNQLLDFKNGVNADKDMYHSGVKMISVNDILTDYPIVYDSIQGQVDIDEDTLKEFGVTYGDILFQRSSETFEDAGKSNVYLDQDKTATYSGFVIRGKKKSEYDPFYLNEALRIRQVRKQIIRRAAGSQHINVGQDSLATVVIPFASQLEQSRIAEILMKWDEAVGLYQQQIEKLNKLKKAALANLFPQKGQTAPKYRFAGFTAPWEQRKFSELAETRRGLTYNPSSIRDSGIRVLRSSNITEDQFTYGDEDVFVEPNAVNIPYANRGDILITSANGSTRLVGKHTIIRGIPNNSAVHGGFMLLATAKNPEFVNALMSAPWYSRFVSLYVAGGNGAIGNLNKNDLDEQVVFVPDGSEQKVIGEYFQQLDNLITLHQRKLEMIINQRKALQQYLLNGIVRVKA